jgi:hypothetical protein
LEGTEGEDDGVPEEEGEDEEVMEEVIQETMFTFEAFEAVCTSAHPFHPIHLFIFAFFLDTCIFFFLFFTPFCHFLPSRSSIPLLVFSADSLTRPPLL